MEKIIESIEEYFKEEPLRAGYFEFDDTVVEKVEKVNDEEYEAMCIVFGAFDYEESVEAQVVIRFKVGEDGLCNVIFLWKDFYGIGEAA